MITNMATNAAQLTSLGLLSKLPAELRHQIYSYHLVQPEPISMMPRRTPSFWTAHKAKCSNSHYKHVRTGTLDCTERTTGETIVISRPSCLILLAASRTIYHEAVAIFYAQNKMIFDSVERLQQFITMCPGRYQFMGAISFEYSSNSWSSEVFDALVNCQRLRVLHIHFHHKWISYGEPLVRDEGIFSLRELRGIMRLELSGMDCIDTEEVDVNDPRAIGPILRRELTQPREQVTLPCEQIKSDDWL